MNTPRSSTRYARPAFALLVVGLVLALLATPVASGALVATKVRWGTVPTSAAAGAKVTVTGSVVNGVRGQKVQLQKRTGSSWATVATAQLPRTRKFSLRAPVTLGRNELRVVARPVPGRVRGSTSTVRVVKGLRAPEFTVSTLPPAFRNRIYNHFPGFDYAAGWSYGVVAGSLPPGIELTSDGYLDGTPTTIGTYTFTVRITAASLPSAQRTFTVVVAPNGAWSHAAFDVHALDNQGRYATLACRTDCVGLPPQVVDLSTGEVQTATWPDDVPEPRAANLEDISGDGRYVLYFAGRENFFRDPQWGSALYLWDRVQDVSVKIADSLAGLDAGASNGGDLAAVDADGSTVVYELTGPDTENNGDPDDREMYVWERGAGTTSLSDHPSVDSDFLTRPEISDDGETVTFVKGNYNLGDRIGLFDRTAAMDPVTWVTPPVDAHGAVLYTLSADGETVAYPRVVGPDPRIPDHVFWETVVWDRAGAVTQVVSETLTGAAMRTSTQFDPPTAAISGDGRFVYFESNGDFWGNDDPSVRLTYFWDRTSGAVTPTPHPPDDPLDWPDVYVKWAEPSYDGSVVYVWAQSDFAAPVYRFDRDPRP